MRTPPQRALHEAPQRDNASLGDTGGAYLTAAEDERPTAVEGVEPVQLPHLAVGLIVHHRDVCDEHGEPDGQQHRSRGHRYEARQLLLCPRRLPSTPRPSRVASVARKASPPAARARAASPPRPSCTCVWSVAVAFLLPAPPSATMSHAGRMRRTATRMMPPAARAAAQRVARAPAQARGQLSGPRGAPTRMRRGMSQPWLKSVTTSMLSSAIDASTLPLHSLATKFRVANTTSATPAADSPADSPARRNQASPRPEPSRSSVPPSTQRLPA
eukprot:scaffold98_cov307-Prasinococcus_capsulatus_cf.AAC.19